MRRTFRWACVAVAAAAVAIVAAELLLRTRSAVLQAGRRASPDTALERRNRDYDPCTVQHPHPHYTFFFPLDPRERVALGNAVCSLDADGFRQPGPAHAGSRRLAFLLGGSAAFGDFASSNDQTISSHLNRLQDEYFFVNAGVPSWNSTQELLRVALDIVERRPALIVAYDGANDAVLAGQVRARTGSPYPPGTPEYFDRIESLLDDARQPLSERLHPRALLPELTLRWDRWLGDAPASAGADDNDDEVPDAEIAAAARRYRANHARMAELTAAAGATFVAVFQPVANLHARVDATEVEQRPLVEKFHREAMAAGTPYAFHDLSNVFDGAVDRITLAGPNLDADAMFVDLVHLTDRGNAYVAERLWKLISARQP
jgi:hypothetical protein